MKRIDFLRNLGFGTAALPILANCTVENIDSSDASTSGTTNGSSAADCTVSPTETAGPFPTKNPATLAITDIKGDRNGLKLTVKISIKNKNTSCGPLKDAVVDIWHCDAAGLYSEYGGTGMQATNMTAYHFLRGRQTTDASGLVSYESIFPGWYPGRAPHIHVHIYNTSGKSLLVTQIAFPKEICDKVYKNLTSLYKNGVADTLNESDNVFRDGFGLEMCSLSGNLTDGYTLTHNIVVNA